MTAMSFARSSFVAVDNTPGIAAEIGLEQSFPNPLRPGNGDATIFFTIPNADHVRLAVIDINGREVALLADEIKPSGCRACPSIRAHYRMEPTTTDCRCGAHPW